MNCWKEYTVQNFIDRGEAEIETGPFGTQLKASEYVVEGIPVINVRNIGFGNLRDEKLEYVSQKTAKRLSQHILSVNDIVFGRKGAIERHALIREKYKGWFQGSDCMRLRLNSPLIDPRFFSYYLLTDFHKKWITNQGSHGATMSSLNQDIISRIPFKLPHRDIQSKIVSVLSAYDDLIETNNQRIRILEDLMYSIYQEWFINFHFSKNEDAKTKMENGIPNGWAIKNITNIKYFRFIEENIKSYDGEKEYFATANVSGTELIKAGIHYTYEKKPSRAQKLPIEYSVWFARMKETYKVLGFTETNKKLIQNSMLSSGFAGFQSKKEYFGYLYNLIRSKEFHKLKDIYCTGATQMALTNDGLSRINVILPPEELIIRYSTLVNPMIEQFIILRLTNKCLEEILNILIPKLVQGEIDLDKINLPSD